MIPPSTLTDSACKAFKPRETQYKKADGGGLLLIIKPNGSKLWRFKYRILRKEKLLSFGIYSEVSLAEAREPKVGVAKNVKLPVSNLHKGKTLHL